MKIYFSFSRIRRWTFTSLIFIIAIFFLFSPVAIADNATEARLHFEWGVKLYKSGKTSEALEHFLLSNRLAQNSNAVFNAAKCLEKLSRPNEAFSLYAEYILFDLSEEEAAEGKKKLDEMEKNVAAISIQSSPEGALIFLDRKDLGSWGTTPRVIAVKAGNHELILELKNHHTEIVPVEAVLGERKDISAVLKPKKGKLRLTVPHEKGMLSIDTSEKKEVEFPVELELVVGEHRLKIEVEGRVPGEKVVSIKEGETASVDFFLAVAPQPVGTFNLISSPPGALVHLDGEKLGFSPLIKDIAAGSHSILVDAPWQQPWKGKFNIRESEEIMLNVTLESSKKPRMNKIGKLSLICLGGALVVTGAATGGTALYKRSEFEDNPTKKARGEVENLNLVTDILLLSGGITLAAGIVWHLVSRHILKATSKGEFSYGKTGEKK